MAQMPKDSWDLLPFNIITCSLRSFRCYAYSFAALHCFSQSRFISGTTAPAGPGLTIFILDEDSQGKGVGPGRWFAAQTLACEWKAWSTSLWELTRVSSNKLNSKIVSELEKGWCNCDLQLRWQVSHHTHHTVEALEKKAQGSQRCPRREVEV